MADLEFFWCVPPQHSVDSSGKKLLAAMYCTAGGVSKELAVGLQSYDSIGADSDKNKCIFF